MADSELERLAPEPETVKLSTGFEVEVVRLKTRQLFRLLKVLTQGLGPGLLQAGLNFRDDQEQFTQNLVLLVIMAIPEAEQAAIGFLQSMCQPAGLTDKPASQLDKQQKEDNQALWETFNREMFNPAPDDTLDLIETIVRREAPELQSLGKRLRGLLEMFSKTGQDKEEKEPEPGPEELAGSSSPEPSPGSSTSSATSTDGGTRRSSTSRSAGSGKPSRQRSSG